MNLTDQEMCSLNEAVQEAWKKFRPLKENTMENEPQVAAKLSGFSAGLDDADVKVGEHCWALSNGQLLVVMKANDGYEVCGPWECGISAKKLQILSIIPVPAGYESTELYYRESIVEDDA